MGQGVMGQGRIAEGRETGELEHATGRNRHRLVGILQLHLRHHQGGIAALEHIQHPIAAGPIEAIAPFAELAWRQIQQAAGILQGNRILELLAHQTIGRACRFEGEPRLLLGGSHPHGDPLGSTHQIALLQLGLPTDRLPPLLPMDQKAPFNLEGHGT